MKKILKKIDIIYLMGILLIGISIYFRTSVFLIGDRMYNLSLLFTPVVIYAFLFGGIIVIIGEFIITKDYESVILFFQLYPPDRVFLVSIIYSGICGILILTLPTNEGYFVGFLLLGLFPLVLTIFVHWSYVFLFFIVINYVIGEWNFLHEIQIGNIPDMIYEVLILGPIILLIGLTILGLFQRINVFPRVIYLLIMISMFMLTHTHSTMYQLGYVTYEAYTPTSPLITCLEPSEVTFDLFLGVSNSRPIYFFCEEVSFGYVEMSDGAELNVYLIIFAIPALTLLSRTYGRKLSFKIRTTKTTPESLN